MKRPRGRPRLDPADRSVDLHFRIPAKQYDAAYAKAAIERCNVPELIRRTLRRAAAISSDIK
jgi:hypothetical protein